MERPWVYAIAGACGLFLVAVAIRHLSSSDSDESMPPRPQVAALPQRGRGESGGWIARPGEPGEQAGRGTAARGGSAPAFERGAGQGRAGETGAGGARPESGGRAVSIYGGGGRAGGTGFRATGPGPSGGGGATGGGAGDIRVDMAIPAAEVPFEGARPITGPLGGRTGQQGSSRETVAEATDKSGDGSKEPPPEDGGPVLSLPFEKSTEPDRGEGAIFEQGVTFDSGEGAVFSTDSQFVVPNGGNLNGEAGSVSMWVQPQWAGGDESNASLMQLRNQDQWENRLQIFKNGRYMRFLLTDNAGQESNIGATIDDWAPGDWHHLAATWGQNADGQMMQSFYVDGRLIGQVPLARQFDVRAGTPLYIGSDVPQGVPGANGAISQFQAYNRALAPEQVVNLASSKGR